MLYIIWNGFIGIFTIDILSFYILKKNIEYQINRITLLFALWGNIELFENADYFLIDADALNRFERLAVD